MSYDLLLDPLKHDLALGRRSDLQLVGGAAQIAQQVKVTLLAFLGEWFLDTTFGVPYFETILIKSPSRATIESVIRAKVREVPGVRAVPTVGIEIDPATRSARITLPDLTTDEGIVKVAVTQPAQL
jgi:hypothetical protein